MQEWFIAFGALVAAAAVIGGVLFGSLHLLFWLDERHPKAVAPALILGGLLVLAGVATLLVVAP
jgi:hypothetical protein